MHAVILSAVEDLAGSKRVWQLFLANVVKANVILSAAKDLRATVGDEILRCAQNDRIRGPAKNCCHTPRRSPISVAFQAEYNGKRG